MRFFINIVNQMTKNYHGVKKELDLRIEILSKCCGKDWTWK